MIQNLWKIYVILQWKIVTPSGHNFAHATTADFPRFFALFFLSLCALCLLCPIPIVKIMNSNFSFLFFQLCLDCAGYFRCHFLYTYDENCETSQLEGKRTHTCRPRQNGHHFSHKTISIKFLQKKISILIAVSRKLFLRVRLAIGHHGLTLYVQDFSEGT